MGKRSEQTPDERAEHTLGAIKEFRRYLEGVEKDLSSMSKKFANKEIAHLAMKLADWMKAILMDEQVFPPQVETRLL